MDFRTPLQIKRDERNQKICTLFKDLIDNNPGVSVYRIVSEIARKFGMTRTGIENVLIKEGLYARRAN